MENPNEYIQAFEEELREKVERLIRDGANYYEIQNLLNEEKEKYENWSEQNEISIHTYNSRGRDAPHEFLYDRDRYGGILKVIDTLEDTIIQHFNIDNEDTNLHTESDSDSDFPEFEPESYSYEEESYEIEKDYHDVYAEQRGWKLQEKPKSEYHEFTANFDQGAFNKNIERVFAKFNYSINKMYMWLVAYLKKLREALAHVITENIHHAEKAQIIRVINEYINATVATIDRIEVEEAQD